jgi:hypothetical protein
MLSQLRVFRTEVVDPDGGIGEDQFVPAPDRLVRRLLRREIFFNFGMVPPREANLRALSRSIRALRASRIKSVFSDTPVNSWAVRRSSSSSAMVVLISSTDYSIE